MGMRIRYMDPKSHDKHIAYVSHLSHISSFMLGKTVINKEKDEQDIFDMAGSGFESTVRLAKSSPAMWTPIFKQNKKQVVKSLEEYILNLTHFKKLLENDDYQGVYDEMQNTNRIKAVSYTHLDVYKRQEVRQLASDGKPIINIGRCSPDLKPSQAVIDAVVFAMQGEHALEYQSYQGLL